VGLLAAVPALAQLKTKAAVEPTQTKTAPYTTSIGAAADRWDDNACDPATVQLLRDAGITNLRFPGNGGIDAFYHGSTGAITNSYTNVTTMGNGPLTGKSITEAPIDILGPIVAVEVPRYDITAIGIPKAP
jgi:hypothetical protein